MSTVVRFRGVKWRRSNCQEVTNFRLATGDIYFQLLRLSIVWVGLFEMAHQNRGDTVCHVVLAVNRPNHGVNHRLMCLSEPPWLVWICPDLQCACCALSADSCTPEVVLTAQPGVLMVHLSSDNNLTREHADNAKHRVYYGKEGERLKVRNPISSEITHLQVWVTTSHFYTPHLNELVHQGHKQRKVIM